MIKWTGRHFETKPLKYIMLQILYTILQNISYKEALLEYMMVSVHKHF